MHKTIKKNSEIIISILVLFFLSGCSHNLNIKNLDSYRNMDMNSLDKPVTIGVIPSTNDIHGKKLIKGICKELGKNSANVLLPYTVGSSKPVDVKAKIDVLSEYKGSGWNFLINWPGFLIFTPAWHGYNYSHKYNIKILLTKASDNQKIDSFDIPINLRIRHADIGRTWTEIGWLEVSLIPFIGGFVFIGYDDDITNLVVEKIQTPIGDYIAQEIVSRINNFGDLGPIIKDPSKMQTTIKIPDSETKSLAEMEKELKNCEEIKTKEGLITRLRLKAPKEIVELWKQWDGKYAMFVHKEANITDFKDMDGTILMVAFINSDDIFGDAQSFSEKSGIKLMIAIQNNPSVYDKQFLEGSGSIGIMVESVAEHYKFDSNNKLLRIEFE